MELRFIEPYWRCPSNIKAICTTRIGGESVESYSSFNLALHVGDDSNKVAQNRSLLKKALGINNVEFLNQIHGTVVQTIDPNHLVLNANADALVTRFPGIALSIMTADCLPVLLTDRKGKVVANAHAGWKGLCAGILENTIWQMSCDPSEITVYLGPCIDVQSFEVGPEVRDMFLGQDANCADCFIPSKNSGKFLANLPFLARRRLERFGVPHTSIFGGYWSTFRQKELFYSYRREGITGRMASLIWIKNTNL